MDSFLRLGRITLSLVVSRLDEIDDLILDMTFKAIRQYHTAILLAIIHNGGLPLPFSFGPQESID
jgi:hypothetical protein